MTQLKSGEQITVTINPDGTAREVNPVPEPATCIRIHLPDERQDDEDDAEKEIDREKALDYWMKAEAQLRTFEIEENSDPNEGIYIDYGPGHECTAEITDTYPEPVEGVHGKVRILS